jgi:hypothetical protein
MQHELNHTVQTLLGSQSLDDVSVDRLSSLTREYPYSSILHFLYSRKLRENHDPRYADSVARTALYFSNPHWLHHQLSPRTSTEAVREMEMNYALSHPAEHASLPDPAVQELPVAVELAERPDDHAVESQGAAVDTMMHEQPARHWQEPVVRSIETGREILPHEWHVLEEKQESMPIPETNQETIQEQNTVEQGGHASPLPLEGLVPLEPLYTIDYFASQGIQLSDEEKQDPLGRKLKSFTEWLKVMKKVHPEKTKAAMDEKTEVTIKEVAEHSNDRAEVLTEAMAEVYLKQGMKHKALEVYQKLSLLNPALSANFAAKIADLNATEP